MAIPMRKVGPAVKSLTEFSSVLDKAFELAATHPELLPGFGPEKGNPVTLSPRIPLAADMATKMVANATNAAENWLKGVMAPRKSAVGEAKAANAKYKTRMTESIADDRWVKGINAIDENQMYAIIQAGGSGVFSSGIQRRQAKIQAKLEKMRPLMLALAGTLDAMPTATDQQREAKMIAARRGMIEVGKRLRG